MRFNVFARVILGVTVMVMSMFAFASGGFAAEPDKANAGGSSAEHRNDDAAHTERDHSPPSTVADNAAAASHDEEALDEPQPASNADFSGNGANEHGPYDSTRDGSPSENGRGDGTAVGKPCAGCVGDADNKNPKGQMPNGTDHNKGYECDENRGIGQSNPAHTGCVVASTPDSPLTPLTPNTPLTPTVQAVDAMVLGVTFTASPLAPPAVLAAQASRPAAVEALATTGAPFALLPLVSIGFALVLAGWLFQRAAVTHRA